MAEEEDEDNVLSDTDSDQHEGNAAFSMLEHGTPCNFDDEDDESLINKIGDIIPMETTLANQLGTSNETASAYKKKRTVKIADNAPIIFSDTKNKNEPIIDHNKLLSIIDIEIPQSIILYSSNKHLNKHLFHQNKTNKANNKTNDDLLSLSQSFWHKEFEKKTYLTKQTVLQNNNEKYKNLKFEYDKYHKLRNKKQSKQPLLERLMNNKSHQIKIKRHNKFKNVVDALKESNPSLFIDDMNGHKNGINDEESMYLKQQLMTQNLVRLTGYDETNEAELLSVNPENIKPNDITLDLSHLLQRNQCDFEHEIIIDDDNDNNYDNYNQCIQIEDKTDDDDDDDIKMKHHKEIEMKPIIHRVDEESLLRANYENRQKMNKLQQELNKNDEINEQKPLRKRKHRDSDNESLLIRSPKRHKSINFKINTNWNEQYVAMSKENKKNRNNKSENKRMNDDDLELLDYLPEDMENTDNNNNNNADNDNYDDDAIGDDLFDMMPDIEEDWTGNDDKGFGVVIDDNINSNDNNNNNNNNADEQEANQQDINDGNNGDNTHNTNNINNGLETISERKTLPLLKCAVNNSSIWPNRNKEFERCKWLDSVIISDKIAPKQEMNTNLIIDLNDHRMEWSEDFVKNMTNLSDKARADNDEEILCEKSLSVETLYDVKKLNLSNDDQYTFNDIYMAQKRNLHTPMAYNLNREIFPQKANIDEWVALHRKRIKFDEKSINSKMIKICLSSKPLKYNKRRMQDITHKYSMYIPADWRELSGNSDRIVLLEYLEEYPLIIQSIGMTSNIVTLYRKSVLEYDKNLDDPQIEVDDGNIKILNPKEKSSLLGAPRQTKYVQIIENKLYVAPIRSHTATICDSNLFLLIGSGYTYYIRKIAAIYGVGQIQPKQVVYHPGSRKFRSYMHDRCKVAIYRILQKQQHVTIDELKKDFPLETEDAIKDTLRTVASHDKSVGGGLWIRNSSFLSNRSDLEIQQMVSPEQEVLRQMFMNCYCRLYKAGISPQLIGGTRGGGWKRVLKNLVFNKDLLDNMYEMKKEFESQIIEWNDNINDMDNINLRKDTNPTLKLAALTLIEELLFCSSWYVSDQFLRCYRGEGEMQLNGYGNPFKDGEGFNYLRDRDKTSSEAIKLMVASAGSRANTKADFRRMPLPKAIQILKQRYFVPDGVVSKLDRRKIMELLQKKSRDALSAGAQNKSVLRYARLTGSRKTFARNQYMKKIKKLMKQHLIMLRGRNINQMMMMNNNDNDDDSNPNDPNINDIEAELQDMINDSNSDDSDISYKKKKTKLKCIKKYKLRYTYCYNDAITAERKKEIEEYTEEEHPEILRKYRLCIKENDKKFTRLREWSKLYQMRMEMDGDDIPIFTNDRQRERYEKMQKIKNMAPEEREIILSRLESEKSYITCSSCKRKGHNSNNKYCPKYHENKERKNEFGLNRDQQQQQTQIDSFIDRAIDKKHESYQYNKNNMKTRRNRNIQSLQQEMKDPRLDFVAVLRQIMDTALHVNGSKIFAKDPTSLNGYISKIREPICLNWISQNIQYTEECIRAPYKAEISQINLMDIPAINIKRGPNKPSKKEYKTFVSFKEDINLIYTNSRKYNGVTSQHTKLALTIVESVNDMERKYKPMLNQLNDEVNQMYKTYDLQPILNSIINGLLSAPTLDAFRSSINIINGVCGLYQIRTKTHDKNYKTFAEFVNDLKQLQQFCYDANKVEFEIPLKILPTHFENKLKPYKQQLIKIDPDSKNHFDLNKKPPFI